MKTWSNVDFNFKATNKFKIYNNIKHQNDFCVNYFVNNSQQYMHVNCSFNDETKKVDVKISFYQYDKELNYFDEIVVLNISYNPFNLISRTQPVFKILKMTDFVFNKYFEN